MYKVRILTNDFHTFHPYMKQQKAFYDKGIQLVGPKSEDYDLTLIGHSLFQDKKLGSFEASLEKGMKFLKTVKGPYILVDGQDSHSLIGSFETFVESDAIVMLKHSLLKDRNLYNQEWVGGRYYWGKSEDYKQMVDDGDTGLLQPIYGQNYKPKDFDKYSDRILLSGTNWIGVPDVQMYNYKGADKLFDVSAMFQYPHVECHEMDLKPSQDFYYNEHRKPVIEKLHNSPYMVAKLYKGRRVPADVYFKYISVCKILVAAFGYGEMAPRDLESCQLGSILIKPDMGHVDTYPNIYIKDKTYIACKPDYSDLDEKIEYCVENFDTLRDELVENMRAEYKKQYHDTYLADYTHKIFTDLNLI